MSTTATTCATQPTWKSLIEKVTEASTLGSCCAVLHWDQETKMPPEGIEPRGRQLALLAGLTHEKVTSKEVGDLLAECEQMAELTDEPASDSAVTLKRLRHEIGRAHV